MTIRWGFATRGADWTPSSRLLADRLEALIRSGELAHGAKLPTQRALAAELGVSLGTVGRALAEAKRRGLLEATVGRGTFVRAHFGPLEPIPGDATVQDAGLELGRNVSRVLPLEARALAETLRAIAEEPGALQLHADGLRPSARHRDAGWRWLGPLGFTSAGTQLLLAGSAQQAIASVLLGLLRRGDPIAHGASLFPGVRALAERLGSPLIALAEDEQGPLPDALAHALHQHAPALLYLTPTLAPLGNRTLSAARRAELAEVLRPHRTWVLEDEDDGALLLDRPPPVQRLLPARTLALVETAKCFVSGSRLAYLVAPDGLAERLALGQRAATWSLPWLPGEVATRWIEGGVAERAQHARRRELQTRTQLARDQLPGLHCHASGHAHTAWLELPPPWSAADMERALEVQGVHAGSSASYAGHQGQVPNGMRLCLGAESRAGLAEALGRLRKLLEGPFRPARSFGTRTGASAGP